jgi:hypothetical protein
MKILWMDLESYESERTRQQRMKRTSYLFGSGAETLAMTRATKELLLARMALVPIRHGHCG